MKINWVKLWRRFDKWWDKNEESFEKKNSERWPYQSKAIRMLVEAELKPKLLGEEVWDRIWANLRVWWKLQKTAHMPWETQQRKIQQVISLEITNAN